MQITHFGHSCLLLEVSDQRILIDPGGFSSGFEDLRDLDAIVVTHQHPDHLDQERLPGLLSANSGARLIVEGMTHGILSDKGIDAERLVSGTQIDLDGVRLAGIGEHHAVIHADIPRIDNTGVVITADGEPTLFHPGDALDAEPGQVDILCAPINAPWCAMKETVDFVRRIAAPTMIPIHDGLLQPRGRNLYLTQIGNLGGKEADLRVADLADAGPTTF